MRKLILLGLLLIGFMSCDNSNKLDLSLNLEEGNTYKYNTTVQMGLKQVMMGQEVDVDMQMESDMKYLNVGKNGNKHQIEANYEYISLSTAMPQMEMKISSDEVKPGDPMSFVFNQMINQKFNFELSPSGRVYEIEGINEMFAKLIQENEDLSQMDRMQLEAQIQQTYGAEAFSANLESIFAIYPDKKVEIGDTWVTTTNFQNQYPARVETTFTLVDADEEFVYLEGKGTIATVKGDEAMEVNGMSFNFELYGENTSEFKLNRTTGWVETATIVQNAKGDMTFANPPQGMEDQAIEMEMNYTINVSN